MARTVSIFYLGTMPEEKRLPELALGKRFPLRLLNLLPKAWKRRHLEAESRPDEGADEPGEFSFTDHFRDARRLLIAWPERAEDILVAFPAARALVEALPAGTECAHLCEARQSPLLQDLFQGTVLEWKDSEIAWHEPAMHELVRSLKALAPDTVLVLGQDPYPLVLQAALRASRARARIGWEGSVSAPYANTRLAAEADTPRAARCFQALGLWRYAGFAPREDWTRLQPDPVRSLTAADLWARHRAAPENTWLYVHDAQDSNRPLDAALYARLEEALRARDGSAFTLGALLWNPWNRAIPREGPWLDAPVFGESDLGGLLAMLDGARGVAAFHGFGLHFASLAEVRVLALLRRDEAGYDASGLNPLFEVEWV
jgi:hypothetical protein